jgi:formyl-CoA transferase
LVTLTGAQWAGLTAAVLDDEGDAAMQDTAERMTGGADVMRKVRVALASMPTAEVVKRLRDADVPVAPVLQLDEVAANEQVQASGTVRAFEHAALGPVHQPRPAPLFDGAPIDPVPAAPRLSEHADEVLREAGWGQAAINALRADGIIG